MNDDHQHDYAVYDHTNNIQAVSIRSNHLSISTHEEPQSIRISSKEKFVPFQGHTVYTRTVQRHHSQHVYQSLHCL